MNLEPSSLLLRTAVERGDLAAASSLLDAGVAPYRDDQGWGPLEIAVSRGRGAMVRLLLARGIDVNGDGAIPPLALAAFKGRLGTVRDLLAAGADVQARSYSEAGTPGWTALHHAVGPYHWFEKGHVRIVRELLRAGAQVDARDGDGATPLMLVMPGDLATMQALILAGADVNAQDNRGWTPLFPATFFGCRANIQTLIEHGAHIDIRDHLGFTAIAYAGRHFGAARLELVEDLLGAGLEPSSEDCAALVEQAHAEYAEIMRALVRPRRKTE